MLSAVKTINQMERNKMHTRLALIILLSSQTATGAHLGTSSATYDENTEKITYVLRTNAGGGDPGDICDVSKYFVNLLVGPGADHNAPGTKWVDRHQCIGKQWDKFVQAETGRTKIATAGKIGPEMRYFHTVNVINRLIITDRIEIKRVSGPVQCALNAPNNIDLGRHQPDENSDVTNSATTVKCTGDATINIKLSRHNIEFTGGATSKVTTNPPSGILKVRGNQTTPVPMVFNTNVSSSSEAGEYTQSLVVTAEIQ
uniref:Fimbrial protein n=1 Tax=Yersinia enterocolitica TaxID=630 RepID=F2Q832_YEREN|nr:hypothetical protein Y69_0060 [Yersinia enterocolitica]